MTAATALQIAATFTWLGMVLGISFLEAPIKFRAPGITVPLGVGIGRLVFRALNASEAVLWIVILIGLLLGIGEAQPAQWVLFVLLAADLILGSVVIRPLLDRGVVDGVARESMPRTVLHFAYIGLEVVKVGLLIAFGVLAFLS